MQSSSGRGSRRGLSTEAVQHLVDGVAPGGRVLRYRPFRGGISASVYLVHLADSDGASAPNARARRLLARQLALAARAIDWRRGLGGTAPGRPEQRRRDLPRGLDTLVRSARHAFLQHYEAAAGHHDSNLPFWDLLTCTLALPEVDHWPPSWRALGRSDLTVETARERLRSMARDALARIA
jgi:hypothetical protein